MNNWMSDAFKYPEKPINRGKRADAGDPEEAGRVGPLQGRRRRRHPVPDGAGRRHAGRTSRAGPGHNAKGQYSERPDDYVENMDRLARKFETARAGRAEAGSRDGRRAPRSASSATARRTGRSTESRDQLREETDVKTSYFRLRAYPFTDELAAFIDAHERVYVIEQNRDAQLLQLMRLELTPERIAKLRSVLHYNGLPIDARSVTDDVLAQEGYEVAKKTTRSARDGGRE